VHVKRANCPAGDFNRSKIKDSYPSLAFECITDYDRRILRVFGPQFGSNKDKHIVMIDDNKRLLNKDWLSQVEWKYYDQDGSVSLSTGVYGFCDNGYVRLALGNGIRYIVGQAYLAIVHCQKRFPPQKNLSLLLVTRLIL